MSETITVWVCSCGHWGKYRTSHQDDDSHTQREIEYVTRSSGWSGVSSTSEVEHREGMVEVYDWKGRYLGCMGTERWCQLLRDDAEAESDLSVARESLYEVVAQRNMLAEEVKRLLDERGEATGHSPRA